MKTCNDIRRRTPEALTGELALADQQALLAHLRGCPRCAEQYRQAESAWTALASAIVVVPPDRLRANVLAAVRAAPDRQPSETGWLVAPLKFLVPGLVAAVATATLFVAHDPDCRTPLAIACCSALWAGVYGLGFAVLLGSRFGSPTRALAARALLAAAGGLLLARACPTEPGERFGLPIVSAIATAAMTSVPWALLLGLIIGAVPLTLSVLLVRASRMTIRSQVATAGIYFAAVAPALYLESSTLALTGLAALLVGTAAGALGSTLSEWVLRRPALRAA